MNKKKFILLAASCLTISHTIYSIINTRSQSLDLPRFMVGWTNQIHIAQDNNKYGTLAVIPQYNHSLHDHAIANCLFGQDCLNDNTGTKTSIGISGSQSGARNPQDWLADYFGLPTDYQSIVSLKPKMSSFIFNLDFYLGFDSLCPNLFVWFQVPIVHSRSALQCTENIIDPGTNNYSPGYFAPVEVPRSALLANFKQFIGFERVPTLDTADGIIFEPLTKSKFALSSNQTINTTQLSDIYTIVGWNFLLDPEYHVGLGVVIVAPTGSRVKDEFIFQPIIGNGHHWELGGYFTSRYAFWHGCDDYNAWIFSFDAIVNHMFTTAQQRTLDIKNSCSSKYMLAQKMAPPVGPFLFGNGSDVSGGPTASSSQPNAQFQNMYTPLANLTSACLRVSNDIQADLAAMFTYTTYNHSVAIDFGYDFWIKTKDKIKIVGSTALASGVWALKGDAYTYGFGATNATIGADAIIPLSSTESNATIHAGTNTPVGTNFIGSGANNQMQNPGIDNPQFGVTSAVIANTTDYINYAPGLVAAAANQQRTSVEPIVLSDLNLDLEKEQKQALTHKFFIHGSYTWPKSCFWTPYLGFGGFVELAGQSGKGCNKNCTLSQCGVWMKSGLSF